MECGKFNSLNRALKSHTCLFIPVSGLSNVISVKKTFRLKAGLDLHTKHPAYGRHQLSWCVRKIGSIPAAKGVFSQQKKGEKNGVGDDQAYKLDNLL